MWERLPSKAEAKAFAEEFHGVKGKMNKMGDNLQEAGDRDELVCFGYRKVPEGEKVRYVLRHFNAIAARYDLMNTLLSFGLHHLWKRRAVKMMRLKEGAWVLDVCGGTADLAILAAQAAGPRGKVVLYDINRAMMARGWPKVKRRQLAERVSFVQGDAEQIPLAAGRFDAAMVGFGIRNLTHMERGFEEMHRALKPGGKLMCLEFSMPTAPVFGRLYDFYSFHVMPLAGMALAGTRRGYVYLAESIRVFPSPGQLKTTLERIGFRQVTHRKLTNGIAVVHLGVKG